MMRRIRYALVRSFGGVFRFSSLRVANWTFNSVAPGTVLRRRFCGRTLLLDVSRSNAQRLLWLEGIRFIEERSLLAAAIRPAMVLVDVGANIGYYTLYMDSLMNGVGRIYSIEPEPDNLRELKLNVLQNRISNVRIVAAAAGAANGESFLTPGINGQVRLESEGSVRVPVVRLDDLLQQEKPDFVKIDVEGFEGAVLEGATGTISRWRPTLFVEIHSALLTGHTHRDVIELISGSYGTVRFYLPGAGGRVQRTLKKYGWGADPYEIRDMDALLAILGSEGHAGARVWVVARS